MVDGVLQLVRVAPVRLKEIFHQSFGLLDLLPHLVAKQKSVSLGGCLVIASFDRDCGLLNGDIILSLVLPWSKSLKAASGRRISSKL